MNQPPAGTGLTRNESDDAAWGGWERGPGVPSLGRAATVVDILPATRQWSPSFAAGINLRPGIESVDSDSATDTQDRFAATLTDSELESLGVSAQNIGDLLLKPKDREKIAQLLNTRLLGQISEQGDFASRRPSPVDRPEQTQNDIIHSRGGSGSQSAVLLENFCYPLDIANDTPKTNGNYIVGNDMTSQERVVQLAMSYLDGTFSPDAEDGIDRSWGIVGHDAGAKLIPTSQQHRASAQILTQGWASF